MLLIDNKTTARVLDMATTMEALEKSYLDTARGRATCRPRIDIAIPTSDPEREYRWGTMEGGSADGYFAIRMKSDIIYHATAEDGTRTQEKYCKRPGLFCGLILLTSVETGEPLALINDGVLQHMRVGGDGGLGVKHMARDDAEVVGMLGSGGMADTHMKAFMLARNIRKLQVYSPTRANREGFAARMAETHGIEATRLRPARGHLQGGGHRRLADRCGPAGAGRRRCLNPAPMWSISAAADCRTGPRSNAWTFICGSGTRRRPRGTRTAGSTTNF